jgi:hypothetical protein
MWMQNLNETYRKNESSHRLNQLTRASISRTLLASMLSHVHHRHYHHAHSATAAMCT